MRAAVLTCTATGPSAPLVIDQYLAPINIGLSLANTATGNVGTAQYSLDDPFATYATDYNTNALWYNVTGMATITATSGTAGSITTPVRAVRLFVPTFASGSVTLTAVQAGLPQA